MREILPANSIKALDAACIASENISSWQLMERAAGQFSKWFVHHFPEKDRDVVVFCGPGNNGGDGLAIARLISEVFNRVSIIFFSAPETCSLDYQENWRLLPERVSRLRLAEIGWDRLSDPIIIDGLFGVGLDRPIAGNYLDAVKAINYSQGTKVCIDLPSGLSADRCLKGEAVKADFTVTFQMPKYSLLFPEHGPYLGRMVVVDIGIPDSLCMKFSVGRSFFLAEDIPALHRRFHTFSHKGDFGRVLVIGGQVGKVGAVVLSAKAALRTGSGLVFVSLPSSERQILQVAIPEVMVANNMDLSELPKFDAIGIGPGWGLDIPQNYFEEMLKAIDKPIVLDADGLNLLAKYPSLIKHLPPGSILTPHLKEFERLVGSYDCHRERLQRAKQFASENQIFLVLKGAYTSISCPDGTQYFNSTGNYFMATAGSGDVLTGILTSFLGQGYAPREAAICGVFHHGLAGDLAGRRKNRGLIASDIIANIPRTFHEILG